MKSNKSKLVLGLLAGAALIPTVNVTTSAMEHNKLSEQIKDAQTRLKEEFFKRFPNDTLYTNEYVFETLLTCVGEALECVKSYNELTLKDELESQLNKTLLGEYRIDLLRLEKEERAANNDNTKEETESKPGDPDKDLGIRDSLYHLKAALIADYWNDEPSFLDKLIEELANLYRLTEAAQLKSE